MKLSDYMQKAAKPKMSPISIDGDNRVIMLERQLDDMRRQLAAAKYLPNPEKAKIISKQTDGIYAGIFPELAPKQRRVLGGVGNPFPIYQMGDN